MVDNLLQVPEAKNERLVGTRKEKGGEVVLRFYRADWPKGDAQALKGTICLGPLVMRPFWGWTVLLLHDNISLLFSTVWFAFFGDMQSGSRIYRRGGAFFPQYHPTTDTPNMRGL